MSDIILGQDPQKNKITISRKEQRNSVYVIGKSGSGKSTLLLNMIKQTMDQQVGMCLIDPHGALLNQVIAIATPEQRKRIILIDITDEQYCCGINLYETSSTQSKKAVNDTVERIMHLWDKLFHITTKEFPQISEYMRQSAHTLVVNPGSTMAEVYKVFRDKDFRDRLLVNVQNKSVKEFWEDYDSLPNVERHSQLAAVRRRLSEFMTDMVIPIVGQSKSTIKMNEIMDARPGKILLAKLDRNQESVSSLIGSMLITLIRIAGFARDENNAKHFIVYSDEFSNYASSEYQQITSELRKYSVCTVMSHQDRFILEQQVPELLRSTLGTNIIVFPLNPIDSEAVSGRFDATPELEETGRRAIQTPRSDVVDWLLAGRTHGNPVVNAFIEKWHIAEIGRLRKNKDNSDSGSAIDFIPCLNKLCLTTMQYKNPESVSIDTIFIVRLLHLLPRARNMPYHYDPRVYYTALLATLPEDFQIQMTTSSIVDLFNGSRLGLQIEQEYHKQMLLSRLQLLMRGVENSENATDILTRLKDWFIYKPYTSTSWLSIDLGSLQWEEAGEIHYEYSAHFGMGMPVEKKLSRLVKGQEVSWYTPHSLEQEINRIMASTNIGLILFSFFSDLLAILKVLVVEQISDDSGQQETTYTKGSHSDKQKEIANMLSGLPNYTAYARIGGNIKYCPTCLVRIKDKDATCPTCSALPVFNTEFQACWSCGVKPTPEEIHCTSCGKKLKQEYTISVTPPPYSPVNIKAEIAKIVQQNLRDGYIRKRTDVEAEIAARQQSPTPAPQPQKPAQPNIPAKRKAAIGKICPKCGANNPATSLFCSQDGTKL